MRAGDRVTTPDGPGTVTSILTDEVWVSRRPHRTVYAIVQLDDQTYRAMYPPTDLEEITMNETETTTPMGGVLIQPLDETTTEPEPEPEPTPTDPEPDEDEKGETEWP